MRGKSLGETGHDFAFVISEDSDGLGYLSRGRVMARGPVDIEPGLVLQWDDERNYVIPMRDLHYDKFAGLAATKCKLREGEEREIIMIHQHATIRFHGVKWGPNVTGGEAQMNFLMLQLIAGGRMIKFR